MAEVEMLRHENDAQHAEVEMLRHENHAQHAEVEILRHENEKLRRLLEAQQAYTNGNA